MYIHACSSMDHFDPTSITHEADNNWALKATNLRKLVRNLQDYYHEVLNKDADFESILSNVNDTAKDSDAEGILAIVELVAVAAISCEDREVFVNRMREISEENLGEFQKAALKDIWGGGRERGSNSQNMYIYFIEVFLSICNLNG